MTYHDLKRIPKTNKLDHYHTFANFISNACNMTGIQQEVGVNTHYKHINLRQSSRITGNTSYVTAKICKSTMMIDLHCSFIATKSLPTTHM